MFFKAALQLFHTQQGSYGKQLKWLLFLNEFAGKTVFLSRHVCFFVMRNTAHQSQRTPRLKRGCCGPAVLFPILVSHVLQKLRSSNSVSVIFLSLHLCMCVCEQFKHMWDPQMRAEMSIESQHCHLMAKEESCNSHIFTTNLVHVSLWFMRPLLWHALFYTAVSPDNLTGEQVILIKTKWFSGNLFFLFVITVHFVVYDAPLQVHPETFVQVQCTQSPYEFVFPKATLIR